MVRAGRAGWVMVIAGNVTAGGVMETVAEIVIAGGAGWVMVI